MAIISVGYDGAVTESQWADMIKKVGSAEYGVVGLNDWRVEPVPSADRTISIATGKGWGHGVFDENTASVTIQLDTVSSGSRWDLIVMKRDWTGVGGSSTFVKVNGTSAMEIPVGRISGPGVIDDQPIALVQVNAGQTAPGTIVDLRVWAGSGGVTMVHDLALTYMASSLGTHILDSGNGMKYQRRVGPDGNPLWSVSAPDGYAPLHGSGGTLAGGIPTWLGLAGSGSFLIQAGTQVAVSDDFGNCRLTFPRPFPNGLLTVMAINGDDAAIQSGGLTVAGSGNGVFGSSATGNRIDWVYVLHGYNNGSNDGPLIRKVRLLHRINWIAIGW
jgi:hypothetical protein